MRTRDTKGNKVRGFCFSMTAAVLLAIVPVAFSAHSISAASRTLPTGVCIVDESNGYQLHFDKNTGAYTFTNCSNFTATGTGKVTIKGSIITLTHVAADRRLNATVDEAVKKGIASIKIIVDGFVRTIVDRNITNDVCACLDDDDN